MEQQDDALNEPPEQSISYNGAINFTAAEEDADFIFMLKTDKQATGGGGKAWGWNRSEVLTKYNPLGWKEQTWSVLSM